VKAKNGIVKANNRSKKRKNINANVRNNNVTRNNMKGRKNTKQQQRK
jgi:hypothetical protein